MIRVEDVVKRYGAFTAVDGVSLDVPPGEIHGFLGPERRGQDDDHPHDRRPAQAHLRPHRDRRPRPGDPAGAAKQALGFIPDRPFLYEKLTAAEFLRFHGGLYGMEETAIADARGASCSSCSSSRAGRTSSSRASPTE